jgi:hypothetical protein
MEAMNEPEPTPTSARQIPWSAVGDVRPEDLSDEIREDETWEEYEERCPGSLGWGA